ncbi:hypothetical protein Dsin_013331 [Dipteronia sinensis]|uniref:Uncharacterized protein n=1 Tax=Dipteronia sinensis TaxID=43782 RepID=A0AAE0AJX6_9ROSI|nr:hypothetical protein Dsin_013331 [Dipteronia sinensis]
MGFFLVRRGTNLGAAVVDLETGRQSWVCRSISDVLAQQLHPSGNVVLCGLRNGAILTVDVRERQDGVPARFIRIHYSPSNTTGQISNKKKWFEVSQCKETFVPSDTLFMPSSISSLVSLHLYDQYFLASFMDGLIKLYDHRLLKRGPVVQSYEGNVNSHTRRQLGVDKSERFVISGGEDCNLRLWSIKSGEQLF